MSSWSHRKVNTSVVPLRYETPEHRIIIIDQTALPGRLRYLTIKRLPELCRAIKHLAVRGAPLLGIAAAYGVVMARARGSLSDAYQAIRQLTATRPTAVNLVWALKRMKTVLDIYPESISRLLHAARNIENIEQQSCRFIGRYGQRLITNGMKVMVHCNAGILATGGIGTALGIIYTAWAGNKKFQVLVRETRPLLQGARLTAWELTRHQIPVICISDSMAATYLPGVNLVLVGADRIARNGDTANKIGTLDLAIAARYYKVPFYVCAPQSTFDHLTQTGHDIPIEYRPENELRRFNRKLIVPESACILNPAFDVTPASLITGFVTDVGILTPPFPGKIARLCARL